MFAVMGSVAYVLTISGIPVYVGRSPKSAHNKYRVMFQSMQCTGQVKTVESLYLALKQQSFWTHNEIVNGKIERKFEITRVETDFEKLNIVPDED